MGVVYCIKRCRLLRDLKMLREQLTSKIEYCERHGYLYVDHYSIRDVSAKIDSILEQLKDDEKGPT
jgi:hypothetical protein